MDKEKRQAMVNELCDFRLDHAVGRGFEAVRDLLSDAFRYGRVGYEQMSDEELAAEYDEWITQREEEYTEG